MGDELAMELLESPMKRGSPKFDGAPDLVIEGQPKKNSLGEVSANLDPEDMNYQMSESIIVKGENYVE